ncbi:MAG: hypothetical protein AAGC85_27190, partial [Bacteroidota bacterium]
LCVMPENTKENIQILPTLLREIEDNVFLKGRHETDEESFYSPEDALAYVSLNPVKLSFLQALKSKIEDLPAISPDLEEGYKLVKELLSCDENVCKQKLRHTHVVDILRMLPGVLSLQELCNLQGGINRRVFTISSIKRDAQGNPKHIRILLASNVTYSTPQEGFGKGKEHRGICNSYLLDLLASGSPKPTARIFVQRRDFGPPEKHRTFLPFYDVQPDENFLTKLRMPLLMIAAGSGISGIHATLQERLAWSRKGYEVGEAKLLFGLQNKNKDFIYQDSLEAFQKEGILKDIVLAESRPDVGTKQYVQHYLMKGAFSQELKEIAAEERGMVLCGDWRMGQSVLFGVLPFLLPLPSGRKGGDISQLNAEALEAVFAEGKELVTALRKSRTIMASASGTRYQKRPFTFEDAKQVLEDLQAIGSISDAKAFHGLEAA